MSTNYTDRPPEEKPETLKPRDIKLIEQAEEYFKKGRGILAIAGNSFSTDAFSQVDGFTDEILIIIHNEKFK